MISTNHLQGLDLWPFPPGFWAESLLFCWSHWFLFWTAYCLFVGPPVAATAAAGVKIKYFARLQTVLRTRNTEQTSRRCRTAAAGRQGCAGQKSSNQIVYFDVEWTSWTHYYISIDVKVHLICKGRRKAINSKLFLVHNIGDQMKRIKY